MEIFLSYERPDRHRAESVAQQLRRAGNGVWLDSAQVRQQAWWDQILLQLRLCDVAVLLISEASLRSQSCINQRKYAAALGRAIIPIAIEPVSSESLPFDLARLQVIDYCNPNEAAAFQLIGALMQLRETRRLPDPLPEPPPLPISHMDAIAAELAAPSLGPDRQLAIIGRLESALYPSADPSDRPEALKLLSQMAHRHDLLAAVDRRIAALRVDTREAAGPQMPAPQPSTAYGQGPAGGWNGAGHQGFAGDPGQQAVSDSWAAPSPSAFPRQQDTGSVSPHWVMAIVALITFFPLGIPAVVCASRARAGLQVGDLLRAGKSATLVKVFFWISIAIWVIYALAHA